MPLQIDWVGQVIEITSPTTDVDAQELHDFIEDEMASPEGMLYGDIIQPEGKIEDPNNPGVYSQIILIFNSPWQIQFWGGSGYTRIYGGKIVGGLADEPMKATGTGGDITVLESPVDGLTVVTEDGGGGDPSPPTPPAMMVKHKDGFGVVRVGGIPLVTDPYTATYSISGTVTSGGGLSGVTMTLTGDGSDVTATDGSGNYSFGTVPDGSYTVTPTKTDYTFTPTSRAVTVSGGDETGKDFTADLDTLLLPLTIDFESESVGFTPSWVTGWTGNDAPTVENIGATIEGLTKCLNFAQGTGATLGAGGINLALGSGQTDGMGLDATAGIKLQLLEHRSGSTDRQTIHVADVIDLGAETVLDEVYFDDREENNPDTARLYVEKDDSGTDSGDVNQTGINNATGNVYRYTRFEFSDGASFTVKVYDTAGSQQGTTHTVTWPGGASTPTNPLKFLLALAGAGFVYRIAQIWIGDDGDSWPTM